MRALTLTLSMNLSFEERRLLPGAAASTPKRGKIGFEGLRERGRG
jgi:hypothetical protein